MHQFIFTISKVDANRMCGMIDCIRRWLYLRHIHYSQNHADKKLKGILQGTNLMAKTTNNWYGAPVGGVRHPSFVSSTHHTYIWLSLHNKHCYIGQTIRGYITWGWGHRRDTVLAPGERSTMMDMTMKAMGTRKWFPLRLLCITEPQTRANMEKFEHRFIQWVQPSLNSPFINKLRNKKNGAERLLCKNRADAQPVRKRFSCEDRLYIPPNDSLDYTGSFKYMQTIWRRAKHLKPWRARVVKTNTFDALIASLGIICAGPASANPLTKKTI